MKLTLAYAAASALLLLTGTAQAAPPTPEPPPATKGPVDGLVSSPDNFKLLLENDHVRVLQYTLLPGALDHWHTHPPRVGYVLSGAKIRVTEADGSTPDYDERTGDNYWARLHAAPRYAEHLRHALHRAPGRGEGRASHAREMKF